MLRSSEVPEGVVVDPAEGSSGGYIGVVGRLGSSIPPIDGRSYLL